VYFFQLIPTQKHAVSEAIWTGTKKEERQKPSDKHRKYQKTYSGIHLLAMPERFCFFLKTFKKGWVWKGSSQCANWLKLFWTMAHPSENVLGCQQPFTNSALFTNVHK
jgi:hypothetical protein